MFVEKDWDAGDRSALRSFLESTVGQRFIAQLWAARPLPPTQATVESAALHGQRFEGYLELLQRIFDLAYPPLPRKDLSEDDWLPREQ